MAENPPAFPIPDCGHGSPYADGMTLRDFYAAHALVYLGLRKDITIRDSADIGSFAYEIADAMLAARATQGDA